MLSRITQHIHAQLENTGYFEAIFPFVEKVTRDGITYPAMYCEKGEYKNVNNFDNYNGVAYVRQNGKQRYSNATESNMPACDLLLQVETPLRVVVCVPKKKLSADDAFSKERVATTLVKALTANGGTIKQELKATGYSSIPGNVDTDAKSILSEEYSGTIPDMNYNFCYCAIDLTITVKIKQSCITEECQMEYYG